MPAPPLTRGRLLGVAALSLVLVLPSGPAAAATHPTGSPGLTLTAVSAGSGAARPDGGGAAVTIRRDKRGHAHSVSAAAGHVLVHGTDRSMSPATAALHNLRGFAADFGISAPARDLRTASVQNLVGGKSVVRFQQTAHGLPVFGGQLTSVLDSANNLLSVNGETSTAVTSSTYTVSARAARAAALTATGTAHGLPPGELRASTPQRWLYDASLFKDGAPTGAHAVWRIEVTARDNLDLRELVLVDARTGRAVANINEIEHANRVVCDNDGHKGHKSDDYICAKCRYKRTETSRVTGLADVDKAFDDAGEASAFYLNNFGVDLTT